MADETSSVNPFKPVEILLTKVVKRYFSAKNRGRNLKDYGLLYVAFQRFYETVCDLNKEIERGMISNKITKEPRHTLYLRDSEVKIEAIYNTEEEEKEDMVCVFEITDMTMDDFRFLSRRK